MSGPSPRVTIAKPARANGALPVPVSTTQKSQTRSNVEPSGAKASAARLKLVVRRLPPGLTQAEYEEILGEEWMAGGTKVDWAVFKPGKISKDPAKPSKPGRAYVHVKKPEEIKPFSDHVQSVSFNDARNTSKDSCLLGPPFVEFAPYGRVPSGKARKDARQGTIDQDPEFIDFLESLTNPIVKAPNVDQENTTLSIKEKISTTPLVDFLKERKANKGKENTAKGGKHSRQDSKDSKALTRASTAGNKKSAAPSSTTQSKKRVAQIAKADQATKEVATKVNEEAASTKAPPPSNPSTAQKSAASKTTPTATANSALAERKRERGNAATAVKMLQRDLLGTSAGRGGRSGRAGGGQASPVSARPVSQDSKASEAKQGSDLKQSPSTSLEVPVTTQVQKEPSKVVAAAKLQQTVPASTQNTPYSVRAQTPSTTTQAFLKHANPSQGITEPLLEEALTAFGRVKKVEIDKKKGFAYVDFETSESLRKAIKSSPVKVAQGQVVVLERKTGPGLQVRSARGGGSSTSNRGASSNTRGSNFRGRGGNTRGGNNAQSNRGKSTNTDSGSSGLLPTAATTSTVSSAPSVTATT